MYKKLLNKREGFTLIELIFVLAIAALIIVIVFLAIAGAGTSAQDQARKDWTGRVAAACDKWAGDTQNGQVNLCAGNAAIVATTAGAAPFVGATQLTATAGAASQTNTNIGAAAATILLANNATYTANY